MIEVHSSSEDETRAVARRIASALEPGDVIALDGPLGSGKTCFVRGLAEGLGLNAADVSSPTFVIAQEYANDAGRVLVHVDAYRLGGPEELESIGLENPDEKDAIIAVEWAARLGNALTGPRVHIDFTHEGDTMRGLAIDGPDRVMTSLESVRCKVCANAVGPTTTTAPFCSPRCRDADLGRWFDGSYTISRPAFESDEFE